jgi:hypothetical protein
MVEVRQPEADEDQPEDEAHEQDHETEPDELRHPPPEASTTPRMQTRRRGARLRFGCAIALDG